MSSDYSCLETFRKQITATDNYGIPIQLTFQKQTTFKSFPGGLITLLTRFSVFAYFLMALLKVFQRQADIQSLSYRRDLTSDETEYNLTQNIVDFAMRLEYVGFPMAPDVQANLELYAYITMSQNVYIWKKVDGKDKQIKLKDEVNMVPCGNRFSRPGVPDYLGINTSYYCPQEGTQFQLRGTLASPISKLLQIQARECNQTYLNVKYNKTKVCKSKEEAAPIVKALKLFTIIRNSYFDTNDFSNNPIKFYEKPYFLTASANEAHYYYMPLSLNSVIADDNMLFGTSKNLTFIETRMDYTYIQEYITPPSQGFNNAFISIYVVMDDLVQIKTRQVYTLQDAFSAVGGFMGIAYIGGLVAIYFLREDIFRTSILKSLYQYQQNPAKTKKEKAKGVQDIDESESKECCTNYEEENNESKTQDRILSLLKHRKKYKYQLKDAILTKIVLLCRCNKKFNQKQKEQFQLYNQGWEKIQTDIDLSNIVKSLRTLRFLIKFLLNKNQRFLLPYFKQNLINYQKLNRKNFASLGSKFFPQGSLNIDEKFQEDLDKNILTLIKNAKTNKTDQRFLKNIDFQQEQKRRGSRLKQLSKHSNQTNKIFCEVNSNEEMKKEYNNSSVDQEKGTNQQINEQDQVLQKLDYQKKESKQQKYVNEEEIVELELEKIFNENHKNSLNKNNIKSIKESKSLNQSGEEIIEF